MLLMAFNMTADTDVLLIPHSERPGCCFSQFPGRFFFKGTFPAVKLPVLSSQSTAWSSTPLLLLLIRSKTPAMLSRTVRRVPGTETYL